jgi:hypothetical protein
MKKLVLFCFLSIVSMLNLAFAQNHLGFWLENADPNSPEETFSLTTPVYGNEDVYYFHIDTACLNLGSCDEKLSIDWEIWRNGVKLDGDLSQYAHVYIEPFITDFQAGNCTNCPGVNPGWLPVEQLRTGSGLTSQLGYPAKTDFPGALSGIQIEGFQNGQGYWTMGSQSYNFLYLHYLLYASDNNFLRLRVDWEQVGDYQLKFKLVRRTGGTDIENYYNHQSGQDLFYGGHSATTCDDCVIAEVTLEELYRSQFADEICAGEVYTYGMPEQYFTSNPVWPTIDTIVADVPFYHVENCRGDVCDSVVKLALIVYPTPPVPTAENIDVCGATNVTLMVTNVAENVTYEWYTDLNENPIFVGESYLTENITNDDATYTYYIIAVSGENCKSEPATVTVTTHPIPVVTLPAVATVFPMNQLVDVTAVVEEGTYTEPLTYVWTGATESTSGTAQITIADTCGSYSYSVQVTDEWGCTSSIATAYVIAEDTEAPVVTENIDTNIEGCGSALVPEAFVSVAEIIEAGYEISDNSGASHTYFSEYFTLSFDSETEVEDCNYKLIRYYILEDRCGNETRFAHTITITDTEAPSFVAAESGFVYTAETQANCTYVIPENIVAALLADAEVADNCTNTENLNIALFRANVAIPSSEDVEAGNSDIINGVDVAAGDEITENTEFVMVVTDACGNEVAINFSIVLPDALTATIVNEDAANCIGEAFTFVVNAQHATAPYTYTWSNENIIANANEATVTPTLADQFVSETFTYTVTVTDQNGCTATAETSVTVNAYPHFSMEGDTVCFGEIATISAAPISENADYTFSLINGDNSNNFANEYELSNLQVGINEFSIAATDNVTGCRYTNPTSVSVLVYALPEFTIDAVVNRTSCVENNGSISFTATTENTVVYMNGEAVTSPVQNLDFGTYVFNAVDTITGCASSIIETVEVLDNRHQLTNETTINPSELTFCLGETTNFVMNVTTDSQNAIYRYGFNEVIEESNSASHTFTIDNPGTYVVSVYVVDTITNCESPVVFDTIQANPIPQNVTLTTSIEGNAACSGFELVLTANAVELPFGNVISYAFEGIDTTEENSVALNVPISTTDVVYDYNVVLTTDAGCTANATTQVTAYAIPQISQELSIDEFCLYENTDVVMNVTTTAENAEFYYTINGEEIEPTTSASNIFTIEQPGTYVVSVYVKNSVTGCVSEVLFDTIKAYPVPQNAALTTNLETNVTCSGVEITLTASADLSSGSIVSYTFNGVESETNTTAANIPVSYVDTTYSYNVVFTTDKECSATASVAVTAFAIPQITAITQNNFCPANETEVEASVVGGTAPYTYTWNDQQPSENNTIVLTNGVCGSNIDVLLNVIDLNGCEVEMSQEIYAIDTVAPVFTFVPEALTFSCDQFGEVLPEFGEPVYSDDCSDIDNISIELATVNEISETCANNYTIIRTWTITDLCNNQATATQIITIVDTTAPVANLETVPANVTINCDEEIPVATESSVEFTDNCSEFTVEFRAVSTQVEDINAAGHYNYNVTRTWTATDACGNVSNIQTQVVTVEDVTAPVVVAATVPANMTVSCDNIPVAVEVMFTDACSPVTVHFAEVSTQDADVNVDAHYNYTITRTWYAVDVTGNNSDTITQVITVEDTQAPSFVVPEDVTLCKNADGSYAELVTPELMGQPTQFEDNCAPVEVLDVTFVDNVENVGTASTDGYIIRTWTVTDVVGNATSLVQTINLTHIPAVLISGSEGICYNGTEILTVTIDGAANGSYVWSTDETTQSISIATEGTYSVVGTLNGCSASDEHVVTEYEHPILTSTVPEIECEGETITLLASAVDAASNAVVGTWTIAAVPAGLNTIVSEQSSISVTTDPLFDDTHFVIAFEDAAHNCVYHDTSDITIISSDPFIRTYDANKVETNHVSVNSGEILTYYIKVFKCSYAPDTRTTLEYDWNVLNGEDYEAATSLLNSYLNTINHNVSYSIDVQTPATIFYMNNEYVNNASVSTFPYATSASNPGTGFTPNGGNAYFNWFYLRFFNDRFIKVVVDRFEGEGEFRVDYQLVTRNNQQGNPAGSEGFVNYDGDQHRLGGMNFDQVNTTTIPLGGVKEFFITVNAAQNQENPEPISPSIDVVTADVNLFPNPAKADNVKLQFQNVEGQTIVRLATLNGKVISEQSYNVNASKNLVYELPLANYAPGIYFVQVVNGETVISKKLIISE